MKNINIKREHAKCNRFFRQSFPNHLLAWLCVYLVFVGYFVYINNEKNIQANPLLVSLYLTNGLAIISYLSLFLYERILDSDILRPFRYILFLSLVLIVSLVPINILSEVDNQLRKGLESFIEITAGETFVILIVLFIGSVIGFFERRKRIRIERDNEALTKRFNSVIRRLPPKDRDNESIVIYQGKIIYHFWKDDVLYIKADKRDKIVYTTDGRKTTIINVKMEDILEHNPKFLIQISRTLLINWRYLKKRTPKGNIVDYRLQYGDGKIITLEGSSRFNFKLWAAAQFKAGYKGFLLKVK